MNRFFYPWGCITLLLLEGENDKKRFLSTLIDELCCKNSWSSNVVSHSHTHTHAHSLPDLILLQQLSVTFSCFISRSSKHISCVSTAETRNFLACWPKLMSAARNLLGQYKAHTQLPSKLNCAAYIAVLEISLTRLSVGTRLCRHTGSFNRLVVHRKYMRLKHDWLHL